MAIRLDLREARVAVSKMSNKYIPINYFLKCFAGCLHLKVSETKDKISLCPLDIQHSRQRTKIVANKRNPLSPPLTLHHQKVAETTTMWK